MRKSIDNRKGCREYSCFLGALDLDIVKLGEISRIPLLVVLKYGQKIPVKERMSYERETRESGM